MSRIGIVTRHPLRLLTIMVLAAVTLAVVARGVDASPSNFVNITNHQIRWNGTGTYDWANGAVSPATCTVSGNTVPFTINCPGTNGLFDGGVFNGNNTPPTPPNFIVTDPSITAHEFTADPLSGDVTACGTGDPTAYTGAGSEKNGDLLSADTWGDASVPAKDDLANVYAVAHSDATHNEVFFGAERNFTSGQGDSHMDFEFLQSSVGLSPSASNACAGSFTGHRTQGDMLLAVDFTKGGSLGGFTLYVWTCATPSPTGTVCDPAGSGKANGNAYVATSSSTLLAAVNFGVNDAAAVDCGGWACRHADGSVESTVDVNKFMEGGIDFNALGFQGCLSTFLPHTRSSQTFTATLKDFALIPFNTCTGSIIIRKNDPSGNLLAGAGYTISPNPSTGTGTLVVNDGGTGDLADGNDGLVCIDGVPTGTYSITETKVPTGFIGDTSSKSVTVGSLTANSTCAGRLAGTVTPDATFTNKLGSILVKKLDEFGNLLPGAGFTFDVNPFTGAATPIEILDGATVDQADGNNGLLCIDNVRTGTYHLTETTVPAGFIGDTSTKTVTVSTATTCATRLAGTPSPDATFVNSQGSLLIKKVAKSAAAGHAVLLGGASFTITPNPFTGTGSLTVTDNGTNDAFNTTAGLICIDNVRNDVTYSIAESASPANYLKDPNTATSISAVNNSCAGRTTSGTPDATFTNTPLSQIQVLFSSLAGTGITSAVIECTDANGNTLTFTGTAGLSQTYGNGTATLVPGTYTCTVVIDP